MSSGWLHPNRQQTYFCLGCLFMIEKFPVQETFFVFLCHEYEFAEDRRIIGSMQKRQGIDPGRGRCDDWSSESDDFQSGEWFVRQFQYHQSACRSIGVEPVVELKPKKKADKNLIDYVMTVIIEFSRRHNLTICEASNYIARFKGIDFLTEFYDVEHTLSFNDCVDDLTVVCQNHGGTLK